MTKKLFFLFFALIISAISFSQTIPFGQGYVINGEVLNSFKGFVTLRSYFNDGNERVDTAQIYEGKFVFRSPIKDIVPALLTVNGLREYRIYLEPTTYTIKLDAKNASNFSVKGSPWTDNWYKTTLPLEKEDFDVHLRRLDNWVINNPTHIFCSDIIASFLAYKWDYEELYKTLNTLKKPATQTYFYLKLREREKSLNSIDIGKKAPDFTLKNSNNKNINLYSFLKGKKFVLINFFAFEDRTSMEENDEILKNYKKYSSKGFDVIGISLDEDETIWRKEIKKIKLPWENVFEKGVWQSGIAKKYMVKAIPYNILVDDKGIIIDKNIRIPQLQYKLEELTNTYGYQITGNFTNVDDGDVKLTLLLENGEKKVFNTKIVNGKFQFKGVVPFVCVAQIQLPIHNGDFSFFMENDKITINGSKQEFEKMTIQGSKKNDLYAKVVNQCNNSANPLQCLMDDVSKNPNTFYAPLVISSYLAPYLKDNELIDVVSQLNGEAKKMYQYNLLKQYVEDLQKKDKIGEKVINFSLPNKDGIDVDLYSYIKDKSYVLIDFWASWCVPCRRESKYLVEAYNKYAKNGFSILGVSLDKDRTKWLKAINDDGLIWENVSDLLQWNSIVVKLFHLESIPQNIVVDSSGNIVARNLRGNNLIDFLDQIYLK
ncbi:MAG: redoxin domain-containing protein [Bacteroidales bacterium]|jgi:peroxiredoxin|nr:redoxin domain-containing protein [Bacteroidales bacterium]